MYNPATGHMCFAEALAYIKRQQPTARAAWIPGAYVTTNRPGKVLTYVTPVALGCTSQVEFPWAPSSDDVLAEDWVFFLQADTQQGTPK